MKTGLHPKYEATTYECSCGNTFEGMSTKGGSLHIELCNKCHPFFTGQQKFVDTGGRVQRFADKFGAAAQTTLDKEKAAALARRAAAEKADAKKVAERKARAAAKAARAAEFEKQAPVKAESDADAAKDNAEEATEAVAASDKE